MDKLAESTMYNFFAPFIGFKGAEDELEAHRIQIIIRRVEESMKNPVRTRASDLEVFYYLQTSTLVVPPSQATYRAIAYLIEREFPDMFGRLKFPHVDLDAEPDLKRMIDDLGKRIYDDQMEVLRRRSRAAP